MSKTEDALALLYESAELRDELDDESANRLLRWAEGEIEALGRLDDAAFDAAFERLRGRLRQINRLVGRRAELSAEERAERLHKLLNAGEDAAFSAQSANPAIDTLAATLDAMNTGAALDALTRLFTPAAGEPSAITHAAPRAIIPTEPPTAADTSDNDTDAHRRPT